MKALRRRVKRTFSLQKPAFLLGGEEGLSFPPVSLFSHKAANKLVRNPQEKIT
jgi:hypothetical protein